MPFLLALCTAANVGSVATLTGNPQNMLVGIFSGISYGRFLAVQLPIALASLALLAALLVVRFRGRIPFAWPAAPVAGRRVNRVLVRRLLLVAAAVLLLFLLPVERLVPGLTAGQKLPLAALTGALAALLVGRHRPERVLRQVDFGLLVVFAALFVVVGGFAHPELMWMVLATASTFAGNLTVVGSVANLIVLEQSRHVAPIGFLAYLRVGVPATLLTTALAAALLLLIERFTPLL